jgi:hypothetical protein
MKKWMLIYCLFSAAAISTAQQKKDILSPATIIITPEKPLSKKDTTFRDAVAKWCEMELQQKDYKKVKAHPSSAIFPGDVKEGYEFINRTINIDHKKIIASLQPVVAKLDYSDPLTNTLYR